MSNHEFIKTYSAGADIPARTIVKFSAANTVVPASAATDKIIGITSEVPAVSGGPVDVVREGLVEVICGGILAQGDFVTSDASGYAVKCNPAAANTARYIGVSESVTAAGDIALVFLVPGQLTTPA
jgi:hypothetical protein